MIRRALLSPGARRHNLLLAVAMGSAALLLGCGGGGGNGGQPPVTGECGSSSGSSSTVVCGYVVNTGAQGVNNATVTFRDASGRALGSVSTANDTLGNAGFYRYDAGSQSPALMKVEAPNPFYNNTMTYKGVTYAYYVNAQAGGECIPAISVNAHTDTRLTSATVYDQSTPPPYPSYPCPR